MSAPSKIQQAAQILSEQAQGKGAYGLDDALSPRSLEEAYAIQEAFQAIMSRSQGLIAGYKIAFTTAAIQKSNGASEPGAGVILANNVFSSPASFSSDDYRHIGIECEVAVRLGTDLPASEAPFDRGNIEQAIESVMTAFEVIDNRRPEVQDPQLQLFMTVAANVLNAGVVLGPAIKDWKGIDLAASRGIMEINEKLVGEGHGSDVMGHPFEPLVWLANMLAKQGKGLQAGMVIITGAIVAPNFLNPGDKAKVSIQGLGDANLVVH